MTDQYNLERFTHAQQGKFEQALSEIQNGKKQTHWMWFVFPQLAGLGLSDTAKLYALKNLGEAGSYLEHPLLGVRLIQISKALLKVEGKTANHIFGNPDDLKLRSCMTLFSSIPAANPVFETVLQKYYNGVKDLRTIQLIQNRQ